MFARVLGAAAIGAGLFGAMLEGEAAHAAIFTDYYGDEDCFGTDHPTCPDATVPPPFLDNFIALYGQPFAEPFFPLTGQGDPFGQDRYNAYVLAAGQSVSWTHDISLNGLDVAAAAIRIRTGGLADLKGPYTILVNEIAIGAIEPVTGSIDELVKVQLFRFPFDPALLIEGVNTVRLARAQDNRNSDAFSWDFSALELRLRGTVAEPAPLAVALIGVFGMAALRRRARRGTSAA
jgi:hypothetical protein